MNNPLDAEGNMFSLSMMNPNLSFKSLKSGDRFQLTVEITQEDWEMFRGCSCRAGMVLEAEVCVAALNSSLDETVPVKHNRQDSAANILHKDFLILPEFQDFITELSGEDVRTAEECKAALKRYMNIGSLSDISEDRMRTMMGVYRRYLERHKELLKD